MEWTLKYQQNKKLENVAIPYKLIMEIVSEECRMWEDLIQFPVLF